jgi:type II secretory pathway component GspD/PulD (secretin)
VSGQISQGAQGGLTAGERRHLLDFGHFDVQEQFLGSAFGKSAQSAEVHASWRRMPKTAKRKRKARRARQGEERLAQAEAVARAGQNATQLVSTRYSAPRLPARSPTSNRTSSSTKSPGTVSVMATERQHQLVQQYLDTIGSSSQRQVLIEATIAEVSLSDQYQAVWTGASWPVRASV